MKKKRLTRKTLTWLYGVAGALTTIYVVKRSLAGKQESIQNTHTCERCQKNSARVRVDQMNGGQLESHFLCQSCVDVFMYDLAHH